MKTIVLAAALTGAALASAASRTAVGDPSVSGAGLHPYVNRWAFTQQRPGQPAVEAGIWNDRLEETTFEGRPALRRTQEVQYTKKDIRMTIVDVFDPRTMEPFTFDYSRSSDGETRHVEFRRGSVVYRHSDGPHPAPEEKTARLDRPVFNFYGLYGVLVSTLPLREGYATEIPAFDTDRMTVDWVPVRVIGRETVEAGPGKTRETWVVETTPKRYGKMTWWVSKDAPYVIRAVLEIPKNEDGSSGVAAIVTYRMV